MIDKILDRLFEKRVIENCDHDPYLLRWFLLRRGEALGVYVHKFLRSDEDRALHDHPWDFLVIPLWRGYREHSLRGRNICWDCDGWCITRNVGVEFIKTCPTCKGQGEVDNIIVRRVLPFLGTRFRRGLYRHRVELVDGKPAWSLFIRFRRSRLWGFWPSGSFVAWDKWWSANCE